MPAPFAGTPPANDHTPPGAPGAPVVTNINANQTATVTVTPATDNVAVAGYAAFLDGSPAEHARSATPTIQLSGVPEGSHTVVVRAFDAAGNYSVETPIVLFTIPNPYARSDDYQIVKNLYPISSEMLPRANSNSGVALDNITLPIAPFGISAGSRTSAGSGFNSQNVTIPLDNDWYIFSWFDYVAPGTVGAKTRSGSLGLFGVENIAFTYDFDSPLTGSFEVFNNSVVATLSRVWSVQDYGNGYHRFSRAFKNNGNSSIFVLRFDSNPDYDKVLHTGFMLEKRSADATYLTPSDYVPTKGIAPFLGQGASGQKILKRRSPPFQSVIGFSDSILGSGTNYKLATTLPKIGGHGYTSTVGGTRLVENNASGTSVLNRYYEDINNTKNALVIFCGGRNDVGSLTTNYRQFLTDALRRAIRDLSHGHYIVLGVLCRFASTGAPGTEENRNVNSSTYENIIALNNEWANEFGDRFVDVQEQLVNRYRPLSSSDLAAFSLGMRPPSLTGTTTSDNLHPVDAETQVMFETIRQRIYTLYDLPDPQG